MGLQLRMKRQADEIIPLLKASSYRCKGAPLYDAYSPDPRHKAILYKTGLAIVVGLCVRLLAFLCLPLPTAQAASAKPPPLASKKLEMASAPNVSFRTPGTKIHTQSPIATYC